MSYESVIAALKQLNKQDLLGLVPDDLVNHIKDETDRAAIILIGSSIEGGLLIMLRERMPSLNGDEGKRIFEFEGPCGSFSNRIRMAQGLGVIDRQTRKQIEIIKEMRNVAAHSYTPVTFSTPEIREAVLTLLPPHARREAETFPGILIRLAFQKFYGRLLVCLSHSQPVDLNDWWAKTLPTLLEK